MSIKNNNFFIYLLLFNTSTPNSQPKTPNSELRTQNSEPRTQNSELLTPDYFTLVSQIQIIPHNHFITFLKPFGDGDLR
jgi:hypothetical protein